MTITRQNTLTTFVADVAIGSQHPIVVQSMTNTDTVDAKATALQIVQLARAGSEIVRITVNNSGAAKAVPEIKERIADMGYPVPIVGDFHYNGHILLNDFPKAAQALDKYRINPGNVGAGKYHNDNFIKMIDVAKEYDKAIRIGVNWGSLDQQLLTKLMDENAALIEPKSAKSVMYEAMIQSVLSSAELAEDNGLPANKIIVSAKVSNAIDLWAVNRELSKRSNYALHLGLTEAGMGVKGAVSSAAALSALLAEGIGDTIRVSLTPEPNAAREKEVEIAQEILAALDLRKFNPTVTACPGCGRTTSILFQEMAQDIQSYLKAQMPIWKDKYTGIEELKVAVMGCIVNGPGESKHADIGISLPGNGENPKAPVYQDGQFVKTLEGNNIAAEFNRMIEEYIEARYS